MNYENEGGDQARVCVLPNRAVRLALYRDRHAISDLHQDLAYDKRVPRQRIAEGRTYNLVTLFTTYDLARCTTGSRNRNCALLRTTYTEEPHSVLLANISLRGETRNGS